MSAASVDPAEPTAAEAAAPGGDRPAGGDVDPRLTDEVVPATDLPVDVGPAGDDGQDDAAPTEVQALREQVAALEARLRQVSSAYKQQQDEISATKERLARQAALKEELRRGEVVGTLFEPVENLRRSLEAVKKSAGGEAVTGLELVLQQFFDAFRKLGLEEVPGKGSRFDPNLHEAITAVPVTDPALDGVVIEVFDTGYRIGSRLLKPSRVVIGQAPDGVGEA
ncbi:nucleotide exchange factor GrpE [Myxococcota bacterium]|nr:nucleotide exchange factor GrpE [Myxococcota bacterium]